MSNQEKTIRYPNRKSPGYWKNWANVEKDLNPIREMYRGFIPKFEEFISLGRSDLVTGIIRYHGGLTAVRKKLGLHEIKICSLCDKIVHIDLLVNKGKHGIGRICKVCDSIRKKEYYLTWEGLITVRLRTIKCRAKKNGVRFNLTKKWCLERLKRINYKCELTNISFIRYKDKNLSISKNRFALSFDRIDSTKGYTTNNIRFCINILNIALNMQTDEEFIKIAIKFLEKKGYQINLPMN